MQLLLSSQKRWGHRRVGHKSAARTFLVEELRRRDEILKRQGSIPEDERTTQQGLYYKNRKKLKGRIDICRRARRAAMAAEVG